MRISRTTPGAPAKTAPTYANTVPTPLPDFAYGDNWIAANGLQLLEGMTNDAPWFLQVNFNGPHEPMDVTASMQARWQEADLPAPVASSEYDADKHRAIRANYAAMIENIDTHLGRYLDYLASRDWHKDTIVIYASDHGEMLGDHDRWGKVVSLPAIGPHPPGPGWPRHRDEARLPGLGGSRGSGHDDPAPRGGGLPRRGGAGVDGRFAAVAQGRRPRGMGAPSLRTR